MVLGLGYVLLAPKKPRLISKSPEESKMPIDHDQ